MAEVIEVEYRANLDKLKVDLGELEKEQRKVGKTAKLNSIIIESAARRRSKLLKEETQDLAELRQRRREAFTVRDIETFNKRIKDSQQRIKTLRGETGKLEKSQDRLGGALKRVALAAGAAFTVGAIISFGKELFQTAVQMEAFERRARIVFGESIDIVEEFATRNAISLGLTRSEFKGAAAGIGDLLVPLGLSRQRAAEMSVELVKLGGALQQFTGDSRSAGEISQLVARALTGEVEALKPLGVSIDQTSKEFKDLVKQKIEDENATSVQAKALAIYELALEASTDALTAFDEDTGSLIRQQAELGAQWRELTENLAEALTPAIKDLVTQLNRSTKALSSDKISRFDKFLAIFSPAAATKVQIMSELLDGLGENAVKAGEDFGDGEGPIEATIITIDLLRKQLKKAQESFNAAAVGSADFANKQEALTKAEEALASALGKETEAQKEAAKEREKRDKEELKRLEEIEKIRQRVLDQRAKDAEDVAQREIAAQQEIDVFKLESAVNEADNIEQRINKEIELEVLRAKFLVENSDATATEQEFIEQQLQENIKQIREKGKEDSIKIEEEKQEEIEVLIQAGADLANEIFATAATFFEAQKQRELIAAGDNEELISEIQKRFARKEAILRKAQATFNIILSTAQGIAAAIATANIPLSVLIGVIGAVQLAAAIAQPIPAFAEGVESVEGPGTEKSDSIVARLSVNERVVSAKKNKKYWKPLHAIHMDNFDNYMNEQRVAPAILEMQQKTSYDNKDLAERIVNNMIFHNAFDDSRMVGKAKENLVSRKQSTKQIVNAIQRGNTEAQFLMKRYYN